MNTMPPAPEALYFDHAPVAHIVAFEERRRLARIEEENRRAIRQRGTLSLRFAS